MKQEWSWDPADKDKAKPEKNKNLIRKVTYRVVGPYLVYMYQGEDRIRMRRIIAEKEGEAIPGPERRINLKPVMKNTVDKNYVSFSAISPDSIQTVSGGSAKELLFYKNILEVIVLNTSYIFNLDTPNLTEINFVEDISALLDPETFIPIGLSNKMTSYERTKYDN